MANKKSELNIGDILFAFDRVGNTYIYLGKYRQYSRAQTTGPEKHLYCRLGNFKEPQVIDALRSDKGTIELLIKLIQSCDTIRKFGRFSIRPISAIKTGHIDISKLSTYIDNIYRIRLRRTKYDKGM